jgi:hypothetical protein
MRICQTDQASTYSIHADGNAITFYPCGWTSRNKSDIDNRYCSKCDRLLVGMDHKMAMERRMHELYEAWKYPRPSLVSRILNYLRITGV